MKRKLINAILCLTLVGTLFNTTVFAFGVSLNSKKVSTSVSKGKTAKYELSLKYDTEVYGIPVPMPGCQIGGEIPYKPLKTPVYKSGSFKSMSFVKKTGSVTGTTVYQCYKKFTIMGEESKKFKVTAKAEKYKASGEGYVGVGPGCFGYDYYFSTKTK